MSNLNKLAETGTEARFNNARLARSAVREIYGRYLLGKDRYPKMRITSPVEEVPPRVRPVASLLTKAWQVIDLDNAYFWDMVERGCDALTKSDKSEAAGLVIAKSGINAVQFGKVSLMDGEVSVVHGIFTPDEAKELVNGASLRASDGNPIHFLADGNLAMPPVPDAVILRDRPSGAASVFGSLAPFSEAA